MIGSKKDYAYIDVPITDTGLSNFMTELIGVAPSSGAVYVETGYCIVQSFGSRLRIDIPSNDQEDLNTVLLLVGKWAA